MLANHALQLATTLADVQEATDWLGTMRGLLAAGLPYQDLTARRHEALQARMRRRELDQANIRYRFGFRSSAPRRFGLVRRAVMQVPR